MQNLIYTLGLDIGIASAGAALLAEDRILALHVRTFAVAEAAKTGDPLNQIRREARSARRRIRRRAHRLLRLRRLFKKEGLIADNGVQSIASTVSPWQLRAEGLDRRLASQEWASVLYHIVKHRGFQSNRKNEATSDTKAGAMLKGVTANQQLMQEKGYRSIGEMAWKDKAFQQAKRNKRGLYQLTFSRNDLQQEMNALFDAQQQYGNPFTGQPLRDKLTELLLARRPTFEGDQIGKMVGRCTFEQGELRAAKACYSAERFVWLSRLNNLKLVYPGEQRPLNAEQRALIIELPFQQGSVKFSQLRKKLELPDTVRFNLVRYGANAAPNKAENAVMFEAKAFHKLRRAYADAGLQQAWKEDQLNPQRLDAIANTIALYREDARIRQELQGTGLTERSIEAVLNCQFEQFIRLSNKALANILPWMEKGLRYDEAAAKAGYHHSRPRPAGEKSGKIPYPDKQHIRNPVVYRAINQARKLINAIVAKYGPPAAIHLELARDLSKPLKERRDIEKEREKYREHKKQLERDYTEHFGAKPNGLSLLKYRLYREQDGQCAYSLKGLALNRLNEDGYVEVDHILPRSRSYDDSLLNKALVLTSANRNKGNRTPFEFMGGDDSSDHWQRFAQWVQSNPKIRQAKRNRYLRKDFGQQAAREFRDRHLNDTRYIGRELKAIIEAHIHWHPAGADADRCVILAGRLTALLRQRWGFNKNREGGDLHHALDAAVIAASNRRMIQRMALHSRYHELKRVQHSYADPETGEMLDLRSARALEKDFPLPWADFRNDVLQRLTQVRVSRAPTRRKLGAAHQDSIRSVGRDQILLQQGLSAFKTPLRDLTLKDLPNIAGAKDPRNSALIAGIRQRLEAFGGNGSKAFAIDQPPLYRPSRPGKPAPIVRSVNLLSTQKSGISVRYGIAANGSMTRVDFFVKGGKFFAVPLYVADRVLPALPNRAVVSGKPECDWPEMDQSYQFLFALYANDWVKVISKKKLCEGYFGGLDRSGGTISIWTHDRSAKGFYRTGIRTALSLEKYHVDMLGCLHRAATELRQPLRQGQTVPS